MPLTADLAKQLARDCGFELAGVAPALPAEDFARFEAWRSAGLAAEMGYMTDHRGDLRSDPRHLLPEAQAILCVGKLYNTARTSKEMGGISRYASGLDYHEILRDGLQQLATRISAECGGELKYRICVDTAPLLERSYARWAGLGWIGRNTCLINQAQGSWFFLGELLLSVPLTPDSPPPDRCGTCRRCIDACPTNAIAPSADGGSSIDSKLCISYLTIEKRGPLPDDAASLIGTHTFGCDICQEVCPWNGRAPVTSDGRFEPLSIPSELAELARLSEEEFREVFRHSPVWRAKYGGFLRNVAAAMGNSGSPEFQAPLERLRNHPDSGIAQAAGRALERLQESLIARTPIWSEHLHAEQ